jgi:hypothetical protein
MSPIRRDTKRRPPGCLFAVGPALSAGTVFFGRKRSESFKDSGPSLRRGACLATLVLGTALPASAQDLELAIPLDCDLSRDCFIQQYTDRDPGPGAQDFTCQGLSYDGHKGTDFALPSLARMTEGVTVIAAAPGTVRGVRDGMDDTGYTESSASAIDGRDCGNGVVIAHGQGWETQYCHMRKGSVLVEPGQRIDTGTPLGLVGQSGRAQFPHLHLSLRKDGAVVDPFDPDGTRDCGSAPGDTLWADPPAYRPGGLIALGFADRIPDYAEVKAGSAQPDALGIGAGALVIYGYSFGTRAGDRMHLAIEGPEGTVIEEEVTMDRPQAQAFRAVGRKAPDAGWAAGQYTGKVELWREGAVIDRLKGSVTLE